MKQYYRVVSTHFIFPLNFYIHKNIWQVWVHFYCPCLKLDPNAETMDITHIWKDIENIYGLTVKIYESESWKIQTNTKKFEIPSEAGYDDSQTQP